MPYKLIIELSAADLRQFRHELDKSRKAVGIADDAEILSAATDFVTKMRASRLPDFVTLRLQKLEMMLSMVSDSEWTITNRERKPILAALAYLCDPEDIIHDDVPGVGLLDDAVMIELVFRESRHEIDAYEDFSQALAMVNDSRYGLQAGIFTRDANKIQQAWEVLEVGGIVQGDVPTWRTDPMPYGGVKNSGVGREGPVFAYREMTEERLLVLRREA